MLIIFPFPPAKGAKGRKKGAADSIVRAHAVARINTLSISLKPEIDKSNLIYQRFTFFESLFLNTLIQKVVARINRELLSKLWLDSLKRAIFKFHQEFPIDISFAYSLWPEPSIFAREIRKRYGISYVIHEHRTDYQRYYKRRNDIPVESLAALESAQVVLALTPQHANAIRPFLLSDNLDILPIAVAESFFKLGSIECISRENNDEFVFAAWTNWRYIKRLDILIKAFEICFGRQPSSKLLIAGDIVGEKQKSEVLYLLENSTAKQKIKLLGNVDRMSIRNLVKECDACVISSDHETFGIPASEALAAGKPVITTRCGGPEHFILEGVNGYIVDKGDYIGLSEKMFLAISRRSDFNKEAISRNAFSMFSIEAVSNKLKILYANI